MPAGCPALSEAEDPLPLPKSVGLLLCAAKPTGSTPSFPSTPAPCQFTTFPQIFNLSFSTGFSLSALKWTHLPFFEKNLNLNLLEPPYISSSFFTHTSRTEVPKSVFLYSPETSLSKLVYGLLTARFNNNFRSHPVCSAASDTADCALCLQTLL